MKKLEECLLLLKERESNIKTITDSEILEKIKYANRPGSKINDEKGLCRIITGNTRGNVEELKKRIYDSKDDEIKKEYQIFLNKINTPKKLRTDIHIFTCKYCDNFEPTNSGGAWETHMRNFHPTEYRDEVSHRNRKNLSWNCHWCGETIYGTTYRNAMKSHRDNCSERSRMNLDVNGKYFGGWKHTKEAIKKSTEAILKWLEDPEHKPTWNKNSPPCNYLKNKLTEAGYNYIEELQPLRNEKIKRYFAIDIAFPEKKVGIEVNGNMHYEKGSNHTVLKPYYLMREKILNDNGWELLQIWFKDAYNPEKIFNLLKEYGIEP